MTVRDDEGATASADDVGCPSVTPRRDGPLVIEGPVALVSDDGSTTEVVERLFLCRCGASSDKPRCDGTHKQVGFAAAGVEPARKPGP